MATKKKEEELAAPEAQSGYDTSGPGNRKAGLPPDSRWKRPWQGPVTAPARA